MLLTIGQPESKLQPIYSTVQVILAPMGSMDLSNGTKNRQTGFPNQLHPKK